ncbi:sporulation initiation phosphotransferase B [Bacillus timonensis]|nr:sporulation initiation phosphotransferase B [Bacillus timonensis]
MMENNRIVDLLRHSRHDWLNKIQLIKGNLALNKLDRVKDIIEEIVIESQNESKLTNLQAPNLAAFLMTYNWETHKIRMEYEVLGDLFNLSHYDIEITQWCKNFMLSLDKAVDSIADNHISITIEVNTQDVRFIFDFSGIINHKEEIQNWLEQSNDSSTCIEVKSSIVQKNELTVIVMVK